jgi:UDP-glucose 4-epimerase
VLTLAQVVAALRSGFGRRPSLLPVPPALIAAGFRAAGRMEEWQRLGGSQIADPQRLLDAGWKPTTDTRSGLAEMAAAS